MKGYGEEILRMEDIVKTFDLGGGKKLTASDHVTISLHKGETLGIVGESGSGKSTLAKILTRLYTMDSGRILLHGKDMTALKGEEFRQARKNIQMVFQDPSTAFDPKQRVRDIICEPLRNYGLIGKEKVDEMLSKNPDIQARVNVSKQNYLFPVPARQVDLRKWKNNPGY